MSAARKPGKRHQRRARRLRYIAEQCAAPGTGLGLFVRGLGLVLTFASLIVATAPGGGA